MLYHSEIKYILITYAKDYVLFKNLNKAKEHLKLKFKNLNPAKS